jgi:hypothetical protein
VFNKLQGRIMRYQHRHGTPAIAPPTNVIPAKGCGLANRCRTHLLKLAWVPACAGMTEVS